MSHITTPLPLYVPLPSSQAHIHNHYYIDKSFSRPILTRHQHRGESAAPYSSAPYSLDYCTLVHLPHHANLYSDCSSSQTRASCRRADQFHPPPPPTNKQTPHTKQNCPCCPQQTPCRTFWRVPSRRRAAVLLRLLAAFASYSTRKTPLPLASTTAYYFAETREHGHFRMESVQNKRPPCTAVSPERDTSTSPGPIKTGRKLPQTPHPLQNTESVPVAVVVRVTIATMIL